MYKTVASSEQHFYLKKIYIILKSKIPKKISTFVKDWTTVAITPTVDSLTDYLDTPNDNKILIRVYTDDPGSKQVSPSKL